MTTDEVAITKPRETQLTAAGLTDQEYGLAAAVSPHVTIANIGLATLSADLKAPLTEVLAAIAAGDDSPSIRWRVSPLLKDLNLEVRLGFEVSIGRKPNVLVACTYVLDYRLDSPPPEESRDALMSAFSRVNGPYSAWPYLRELVQTTCARMNIPPPVIPVFRVIPPKREKTRAKADQEGRTDETKTDETG